ncbi:MAG: hypothetical protein H2172_01155 [Opitutus sp.]|nr:hypothetical protein [Opitutus sp.]MCS6247948.1 hypothetical protein [Opitutus sp.]MCS6274432.1 hypothetical protein [Opitutus sp.]MCS6277184.1 hypothetical protein [Opitutus sp.]MCS6300306.1 hypothetical protein [Opitutus sp.]
MPVIIVGTPEGKEREAAEALSKTLTPRLRKEDKITIVVGAQCVGQNRKDIDLILFGSMGKGFILKPGEKPDGFENKNIYLNTFCLVVEVKGHSSNRVRIQGTNVDVEYKGRWSSATAQAHEQVYSVKEFIERHKLHAPYILNAVWLRNQPRPSGIDLVNNILWSDLNSNTLIKLIAELRYQNLVEQARDRHDLSISCSRRDDLDQVAQAADIFTRELAASPLDRSKLELICKRIIDGQIYATEKLGKQMLLFRGQGGSGKTVRLLQLAKNLYEDQGTRILFLTFNRSLVADVRRLLVLMRISDKPDDRTIVIRTCDSYFFKLLDALGLHAPTDKGAPFPADYAAKKLDALQLISSMSREELLCDSLATKNPDLFSWDFVMIDEAQDWPDIDKNLLFKIFGHNLLFVADGVDQFVRGNARCDWTESLGMNERQIVPLRKCLRLKANLCRFISAFADEMNIPWNLSVNDDVPGGRVIIIKGPYTQEIHSEVMKTHQANRNEPVDSLFCVTASPQFANHSLANRLESWGEKTWDGTNNEVRDTYPTDTKQIRIVRYESCRGLEGWTVVCLDAERFFGRQVELAPQIKQGDLLISENEAASHHAARWLMIAFTRAIDTLVIQVSGRSQFTDQLLKIAKEHNDFIEVLEPLSAPTTIGTAEI